MNEGRRARHDTLRRSMPPGATRPAGRRPSGRMDSILREKASCRLNWDGVRVNAHEKPHAVGSQVSAQSHSRLHRQRNPCRWSNRSNAAGAHGRPACRHLRVADGRGSRGKGRQARLAACERRAAQGVARRLRRLQRRLGASSRLAARREGRGGVVVLDRTRSERTQGVHLLRRQPYGASRGSLRTFRQSRQSRQVRLRHDGILAIGPCRDLVHPGGITCSREHRAQRVGGHAAAPPARGHAAAVPRFSPSAGPSPPA